MSSVLGFLLILLAVSAASADEVVFTRQGLVAAPATRGYVVFSVSEGDVRGMYAGRAQEVLESYRRYVSRHFESAIGCLSLGSRVPECRAAHATLNETSVSAYWRELSAVARLVNATVDEVAELAFSGARSKRSPLQLLTALGTMVTLGVGVKNAWDLHALKAHLQRTDGRLGNLVLAVDGISRTLIRDHRMVEGVLDQVLRQVH